MTPFLRPAQARAALHAWLLTSTPLLDAVGVGLAFVVVGLTAFVGFVS